MRQATYTPVHTDIMLEAERLITHRKVEMMKLQRIQDQARKYNATSKIWDRLFVGILLTIIVLGSIMLGMLVPELQAALEATR
jgi:TRAP-type mannitol/chloroaromatic compound transport system permease large subunit